MIHTDGLFTDLSCKNAAASSLSISEIVVDVHASDVQYVAKKSLRP